MVMKWAPETELRRMPLPSGHPNPMAIGSSTDTRSAGWSYVLATIGAGVVVLAGLALPDDGQAARLALSSAFVMAAAVKLREVRQQAAAWNPIILSMGWRRHASVWITISALLDVAAALLLVTRPMAGGLTAIALIGLYSAVSIAYGRETSECGCFIGLLNARTSLGLLARNLYLAILAITAIGAVHHQGIDATVAVTAAVDLGLVAGLTRLIDSYEGRRRRAGNVEVSIREEASR